MHRSICICALLPRIVTRTRVLLVLHQLEVQKPTNTGVIAARCLPNSAVAYRGRSPDGTASGSLEAELQDGVEPVLLFPDPAAAPLEQWRGHARPLLLVVPDGTWSQAARTRRRVSALAGLPCAALSASEETIDRLRRPPRPGRLATLEALALALGILEGPSVGEALMRVYRIMTERTLWTNGRLSATEVTGGIPAGARSHDPLGVR